MRIVKLFLLSFIIAFAYAAVTGMHGTNPPAQAGQASQTPSQFYLEYRSAFDKATKLEDILPFMAAQKRKEAEAMPALVRDRGLPVMKSMSAATSVRILKEESAGDAARLTVEGVHAGTTRTATVTIVRESGAWKIRGESWR